MLTLDVMYHDMNVQILLAYQPVHLGDQSLLILGLDRHQPSPQTPLVSYEYFDKTKQGCLSPSHDSLSTIVTPRILKYLRPGIFFKLSHAFIYVAWIIQGQRVLYKLALFTLICSYSVFQCQF